MILTMIIIIIIICSQRLQDATVMTMGFETLPHNDAAALMNHLATKGDKFVTNCRRLSHIVTYCHTLSHIVITYRDSGPLSASVAASDWSAYRGGVFDGCDYDSNMVL